MKKIPYYNNERPEIARLIPLDIKTLLDVGCGHGFFLKLIKEKTGAETWGIEVAEDIAEKAKKFSDKIIIGRVEDVISLIPDNYFDCITLNDLLEHLLEPSDILRYIKPKLSKKGVIVASIPNVRYFYNLYEFLVKKDWKYESDGILDSTHIRFFTKKSMKRLFDEAGYTITIQKGINKIVSPKVNLFLLLSLGFLNDTRYLQYVCVAKAKL